MITESYWAAEQDEKKLAANIWKKIESYYDHLDGSGRLELWKRCHRAYFSGAEKGGQLQSVGEQGEYLAASVNDFRSLLQRRQSMVMSQKPSFEVRAVNSDVASQVQTAVAQAILEYDMREKGLEQVIRNTVEFASYLGEGWSSVTWNPRGGKEYAVDPGPPLLEGEGGGMQAAPQVVREGEVEYGSYSPVDVVRDWTKTSPRDHSWVCVRRWANKCDLAALFPDKAADLYALSPTDLPKNTIARIGGAKVDDEDTDDVPVWDFYHAPTPALPNGLYVSFANSDTVLERGDMPYENLPIFRLSSEDQHGGVFGYTTAFDMLLVQSIQDSLDSTICTNQRAGGVQTILKPRGCNLSEELLGGGLRVLEFDPGVGPPTAVSFTATPREIFEYRSVNTHNMELLSGVNAVARGNVPEQLRSGNALALVQAQAVEFAAPFQQSVALHMSDIGTASVRLQRERVQNRRVLTVIGKSQRPLTKYWTGDDLASVDRVYVDMGNPVTKTVAARVSAAEKLAGAGLINAEQYLQVAQTGKLEVVTEGKTSEFLNIRAENEKLSTGQPVRVLWGDHPFKHIQEHFTVLQSPEVRETPDSPVVQLTLEHIQEHLAQWQTMTPDALQIMNIPPPPMMGPPPGMEGPPPGPPGMGPPQGPPPEAPPMGPNGEKVPKPAQVPANPMTGEQDLAPNMPQ